MSHDENGQVDLNEGEEDSPARIGGCHVRVLDIARYHERWHMQPEQIVEELGVLSMAEVCAALSYYHSHKEEMDAQMETEEKLADELEDQVSKPLKEKLAELDAGVVRYHLDRSCPNSLGQALRDRGIDVTTTPEVWLRKASDAEQLSYTHSSHRILLTRDLDFLGLKQDPGRDHSGIFYLHPLHTPAEIVKLLTKIHDHINARQFINRVEFL